MIMDDDKHRYELASRGQYIKNKTASGKRELLAMMFEWLFFAEPDNELTIKVKNR